MFFDMLLVRAVKNRESLYNMRHRDYKDNNMRIQLWNEIALEVKCEMSKCQTRWKSIRYRFKEETRKLASGTKKKKKWELFDALHFLRRHIIDEATVSSLDVSPETSPKTEYVDEQHASIAYQDIFEELDELQTQDSDPLLLNSTGNRNETEPTSFPSTESRSRSSLSQKRNHCDDSPTSKRVIKRNLETLLLNELQNSNESNFDDVSHFLLSLGGAIRSLSPLSQMEVRHDIQKCVLEKLKQQKRRNS